MCFDTELHIEVQTPDELQDELLFLRVLEVSSVILAKPEQGLNAGLKAAVQEVEAQAGHGGLKLPSRLQLEPRYAAVTSLDRDSIG